MPGTAARWCTVVMDTHPSRPRPLRNVTATATATGSALAVVLLPLLVGALVARSAGGDPMASVNALIAGGGERAKLTRNHLPVLRGIPGAPRRWGRRLLTRREDVCVEVGDGGQR
ncbi:hypothetical protein SsS58_03161 [Streptomyces scabiei]|jgi:hypothetical protein|uniref:Uncharacterized protein n=2 Tax=Streptomyces scabiei TaxID=1930 RepID=A0A100JNK9_STRSC|nr:hypothetical protein SsS58_03161 [Streptomyces scabiei]